MRRIILAFIAILISFLFNVKNVSAANIAGVSATISYNLANNNKNDELFLKKIVIERVLTKYSSPLKDEADSFVKTCASYNLDCYLLPSITGVESTFGKFILNGSYNPFGWDRGLFMFNNWSQGIDTVGHGIRENYINKGATTVDEIGSIYCEGNTWAGKVKLFMNEFQKEEEKINLFFTEDKVEL